MKNDINLFDDPESIFLKKISSKKELVKEDARDGYLIESGESEARKIIESIKTEKKLIAIQAKDDAFNRRAIEKLKINYIVSPEVEPKKDTLKQRDSGINHVLAKEAAKRNISLVIDIGSLQKEKGKKRAILLSRIMQTIAICKKAKCKIKIASLAKSNRGIASTSERMALGMSLGMSSKQAKEAIEF